MRIIALTSLVLALSASSVPLSSRANSEVSVTGKGSTDSATYGASGSVIGDRRSSISSAADNVTGEASGLVDKVKAAAGSTPSVSTPGSLRSRNIGDALKKIDSSAGAAGQANGTGTVGKAVAGAAGKADGSLGGDLTQRGSGSNLPVPSPAPGSTVDKVLSTANSTASTVHLRAANGASDPGELLGGVKKVTGTAQGDASAAGKVGNAASGAAAGKANGSLSPVPRDNKAHPADLTGTLLDAFSNGTTTVDDIADTDLSTTASSPLGSRDVAAAGTAIGSVKKVVGEVQSNVTGQADTAVAGATGKTIRSDDTGVTLPAGASTLQGSTLKDIGTPTTDNLTKELQLD